MPEANLEDRTHSDLMDQIESALSPFDDEDTVYQCYDGPFHPERLYHAQSIIQSQQSATGTLQNIVDELAEQIDMDNEYLSYVTNKVNNNANSPCYSTASKSSSIQSPVQCVINTTQSASVVPEDILQTAISLQDFTTTTNSSITVSNVTHVQGSDTTCANKEYLKHFDELQQYSDLIRLPDMTSRLQHITPSSSQSEAERCQQNHARNKLVQTHSFYDDDSNDTTSSEFMSWTIKHPENWSATEVLDWLYYSAEKHGADCSLLRGEAFRTVNGEMLCKMNIEEFRTLDPYFGDFLYKLFRKLVGGLHFAMPSEASFSDPSDLDQTYSFTESQGTCFSIASSPNDLHNGHVSSDVSPVQSSRASTHTSPDSYPHNEDRFVHYEYVYAPSHGAQSTSSLVPQHQTTYHYTLGQQSVGYPYDFSGSQYGPLSPKSQYKMSARERYDTNGTPRRRPGRPRIKSIPTEEELQAQREKKMKSQHLWEFIYDMLTNPLYNPSVLKWENQSEGVFRFVQSESVAQLWGTLKSNENMTYEKLSRAMRHYYKRGILERVEGRRLVYKFSRGTLERMRQKKAMAAEVATSSLTS